MVVESEGVVTYRECSWDGEEHHFLACPTICAELSGYIVTVNFSSHIPSRLTYECRKLSTNISQFLLTAHSSQFEELTASSSSGVYSIVPKMPLGIVSPTLIDMALNRV